MTDEIKAMMPKRFIFGLAHSNLTPYGMQVELDAYYDREIVPLFENAKIIEIEAGYFSGPELGMKSKTVFGKQSALLINIKPLDQAVTKEEVKQATTTREFNDWKDEADRLRKLLSRIEKFGIKP